MSKDIKYLESQGKKIAYMHQSGEGVGVLLALGNNVEISGHYRVAHLSKFCAEHNRPFTCFDYTGQGMSEGELIPYNVDVWSRNLSDVLNAGFCDKYVVLGVSMGGYLMLPNAIANKDKIVGLVGSCAGFGSYITQTGKSAFSLNKANGDCASINLAIENGYHVITHKLDITCPVRLYHSIDDDVISWKTGMNLFEMLASTDKRMDITSEVTHKTGRDKDLAHLETLIKELW